MLKLFDYLFYKIYKLINYLGNSDYYPESKSWILASMCLWLNMLTLLSYIELQFGKALTNTSLVIIFYFLYLTITYFYFFKKERFKKILEKFDSQPKSLKIRGAILTGIYVILTLVFHIYFSEQRREMALKI